LHRIHSCRFLCTIIPDTSSIRTAPIANPASTHAAQNEHPHSNHLGFVRAASATALHTAQAAAAAREAGAAAALRAQRASEHDRAHADAIFSAPKVQYSAVHSGNHSAASGHADGEVASGAGQAESVVPRASDWRARVKLQQSAPPM
jgi:hypothetical protein